MNPILQNVLAVIAGIVAGSVVNMSLILSGHAIIAPPAGVDLTSEEGLIAAMPLMEPQHLIMPFLAHALGTFVGALVAAMIAANNKMKFAIGIGVYFLFMGIIMAIKIPAPIWFVVVDLVGAYLPMAYLAGGMLRPRRAVV